MRSRPFPTFLVFLVALGALLAPGVASAFPLVGIADQKPDMFEDARFKALKLRTARVYVPYDVTTNRHQIARLDTWMAAAKRNKIAPLVTLERSSDPHKRGRAPSVALFRRQVTKLRKRYRFVHAYSVWNEANHSGQPLYKRPDLAAKYYRVLMLECPSCKILAADLLDLPNMVPWAKAFEKALGRPAKYWVLHNYLDANRFKADGTKKLLRAVKGQIWLTEVGGLVARRNASSVKFPGKGTDHAKKVTQFIFDTLVRLSPRIGRVYLYHWNSSTRRDSWDSAFIGSDGKERPSLNVLRVRLGLPMVPPQDAAVPPFS